MSDEMILVTDYGVRDITAKDTVLRGRDGELVLRSGHTDLHLRFKNLGEYAGWLDRNADYLGSPTVVRQFAKKLLEGLGPDGEVTDEETTSTAAASG